MSNIKISNIYSPAVAHFFREVSAENLQDPTAPFISEYEKNILPISYLCWLYNEWVEARGLASIFRLKRRTFTSIASRVISPNVHGVKPLKVITLTSRAIRCAPFKFIATPRLLPPPPDAPVLGFGDRFLGVESGAFKYPTTCNDPTVNADLMFLRRYLKRANNKYSSDFQGVSTFSD